MSFTGLINLAEELTGLSVPQLVQKGYPEEVARKIASGELPMDPQSIATRQGQMGMTDDRFLRGHSANAYPKSNEDMFMVKVEQGGDFPGSKAYGVAESYARGGEVYDEALDDYVTMPGEVTPLRHNADRLFKVDVGGDDYSGAYASPPGWEGIKRIGSDEIASGVRQYNQETGLQGTVFEDMVDYFNNSASEGHPTDIYNVLGSRPDVQIRHADRAAYDPDYKGDNIMGFAQSAGDAGQNAVSAFLSNTTSIEDQMGDAATAGLLELGVSPERAEFWGPIAAIAPQFLPGVGLGVGVDNTVRALNEGNYGEAAFEAGLTALGEIPIFGDLAAKGMRTGADKLGIFAGDKATTAWKPARDEALEMQKEAGPLASQGPLIERQREVTGEITDGDQLWFVGADGQPRYEISDHEATVRGPLGDADEIRVIQREVANNGLGRESGDFLNIGRLSTNLDHRPLFLEYPQLRGMDVLIGDLDGARAAYGADPDEWPGMLFLDAEGLTDATGTTSGILHELQHAIQDKQGWARGSSPNLAKGDLQQWANEHYDAQDYADFLKRNQRHQDLTGSATAEHVMRLRERAYNSYQHRAPRPGLLSNQSEWYKYGDKIRSELGPMPKRPGADRDIWQARAYESLAQRIEADMMENGAGRAIERMRGLLDGGNDIKAVQKAMRADGRAVDKVRDGFLRYSRYNAKHNDLASKDWRELYGLSAGEAEARAVQKRMSLTPAQRAAMPIQNSYTIPGYLQVDNLFGTPDEKIVPIESLLDVIGFPDV